MNARLPVAFALALVLSACATESADHGAPHASYSDNGYGSTHCANCGIVDRIEQVSGDRQTNGSGALVGGILGGVLGNQVGNGDGRKAATVAGVVAGAAVGNQVEKNQNGPSFDLYVRMDDGRRLIFNQRDLDGIHQGSQVQADAGKVHLIR